MEEQKKKSPRGATTEMGKATHNRDPHERKKGGGGTKERKTPEENTGVKNTTKKK